MISVELPTVQRYSIQEAITYRGKQIESGLPPCSPPIEMSRGMIGELYNAAYASYQVVSEQLKETGSVTSWLKEQAPHLGTVTLNFSSVNQQLEDKLKQGWQLPLVFDSMLAMKGGKPRWALVEAQTAIWHVLRLRKLVQYAGYNPDSSSMWYGEKKPSDVLDSINQGEPTTVMDMEPFKGGDKILMAQALGSSFPISPLDIRKDLEGYYHYTYAVDQEGRPIPDNVQGEYIKTDEKIRIKKVIARMAQPDLDSLDSALAGDEEQRNLILEFLADPSIVWHHHPSWAYIIEKRTIKDIRNQLISVNSPYADLFVPIFTSGDEVPPGTYIVKPTDSAGGAGQHQRAVGSTESFHVPPGYVAQEKLIPYPLRVPLDPAFTNAFKMPEDISKNISSFFGWDSGNTPGTLELRLAFLPGYGTGAMPSARLAPRWEPTETRTLVKTNRDPIANALINNPFITPENQMYVPFGVCSPIIIR